MSFFLTITHSINVSATRTELTKAERLCSARSECRAIDDQPREAAAHLQAWWYHLWTYYPVCDFTMLVSVSLTGRFMEVPRPTWDSVKDEPEVKEVLGKPAKTLDA